MGLITPDYGLFFWMLFAFGILAFILKKYAWKPIVRGLNSRERSIAEALDKARQAAEDVSRIEAQNAQIVRETQAERDRMVAEARETRERIVAEAKEEAQRQAALYMEKAREQLAHEEAEMRRGLRSDVARIAVEAAERILRERLGTERAQLQYVDRILDELMADELKSK